MKQTLVDYINAKKAELRLAAQVAPPQNTKSKIPGAPMPNKQPGMATQPQAQPNGMPPQQPQMGPDGKPLVTGKVPPPENPTPQAKNMADHVANHVQDPLGSTKEMFDNLQDKNLQYETAKEEAKRQLLPVKQVIQHVEQTHNLNPDEQMGWTDPNTGMPMNGMMPGATPGAPMGPMAKQPGMQPPGMGPGIPPNMAQTPGQMNMNRPSQAGFAPGTAPGQQTQVRPGKMGQPQPGQGDPAERAGNPKPGGAKSNGNGSKGKAGKKVTVHVQGRAANDHGIRPNTPSLRSQMDASSLNVRTVK